MSRVCVLALAAVLWSLPAWAELPTALCPTLLTDIAVTHQAEFAPLVAAGNEQGIADAYNLLASPPYWVWKTTVDAKALYQQTSVDGTTWNYDTALAQAVGERDVWTTQIFLGGTANFALANTRAGVEAIYKSGPGAVAQKTHIYAMARRPALRGEQLFHRTGAGFGDGTTAAPATMSYEGTLSAADVACALRPPS
jgi:hypothetical protein